MEPDDMATLADAVETIRKALLAAEEEHPESKTLKKLHKKMDTAFRRYGPRLGLSDEEIVVMAGGGTPKSDKDK